MSLAALFLHLAPPPNPASWPGAVSEASDLEAGDVTPNLAGDNQCFTPSGVLWFPPLPSAIITSRWKHLNQPTSHPPFFGKKTEKRDRTGFRTRIWMTVRSLGSSLSAYKTGQLRYTFLNNGIDKRKETVVGLFLLKMFFSFF